MANIVNKDPLSEYISHEDSEKIIYKLPKGVKFMPNPVLLMERFSRVKYNQNPFNGETQIITCYKNQFYESSRETLRADEGIKSLPSGTSGGKSLEQDLSPGEEVEYSEEPRLDNSLANIQGVGEAEDKTPYEDNDPSRSI